MLLPMDARTMFNAGPTPPPQNKPLAEAIDDIHYMNCCQMDLEKVGDACTPMTLKVRQPCGNLKLGGQIRSFSRATNKQI